MGFNIGYHDQILEYSALQSPEVVLSNYTIFC